ncbi:MAG: amidohydrolase family protein, partial [Desulfobacterales bacterium]
MGLKWACLIFGLLALGVPADVQNGAVAQRFTAFVNVNLVPMTAEVVLPGQTVLVKDGRIAALGPSGEMEIPGDAQIVPGADLYLLPGLADMHIHTESCWLNGGWPVPPPDLFLINGVTTVRDFGPGGVPDDYALYWREAIEKGRLRGPTLYAAGPILYGPVDDPARVVRRQQAQGFDFVKLYSFLSPAEFQEALAAAKGLNIYSAGHIPFAVGLAGVLAAGMDEIAHIEELDFEFLDFDRSRNLGRKAWFRYLIQAGSEQMNSLTDLTPPQLKAHFQGQLDAVLNQLRASDTPLCTTLSVDRIMTEKLFHPQRLISSATAAYLPCGFIESLAKGTNRHQVQFRGYEDFALMHDKLNRLLLRELHAGGVTLVAGTDAGDRGMGLVPGFSLHQELAILVSNGLRPFDAIATATVNAAKVVQRMKVRGDFGTIESGKRADLLLVAGNPLADIVHLKQIRGVMAAGRWYDQTALNQMRTPRIPVSAAVKHVSEPQGGHYTYLDVHIGPAFEGDLPSAVDTLQVTGPEGRWRIQKEDFTYLPGLRDFWLKIPGKPHLGLYTVEVRGTEAQGMACDIQSRVETLPPLDPAALRPRHAEVLNASPAAFAWQRVSSERPLYYLLEVQKARGGRVYATGYEREMGQHTLPPGVLAPGHAYRWRVRVA